ncbi:MAG: hypothetical protein IEMM0008_1315 [bacterium]|nr:MAG: hypothetical protein IEMM0008_1315 [bacterium]
MKSNINRRKFIRKSVGLIGAMVFGFGISKLFNDQDKNPKELKAMIHQVSKEIRRMIKGRKNGGHAIVKAFEKLPEKERSAIILHDYEDLSPKEIGNILSLTEYQVLQMLAKGLLYLKSALLKRFA